MASPKHARRDALMNELSLLLGDDFTSIDQPRREELALQYANERKTVLGIYVTWFFGFHYAYLGNVRLFLPFILTFGGLAIWWVIDLYRLRTILNVYNRKRAQVMLASQAKPAS